MKYLIVLKNAALILAVIILNSVAFSAHTSAMPVMSHEMSDSTVHHNSNDSASCVTQCRTVVFNKDEYIDSDYDEDNNEPVVPFYVLSEDWQFSNNLVSQKLYAESVKPPPKIPIYILYSVFRV